MSLYQQVAKKLRQRIEAGNYQPGEALPRQAELALEFNTSRITIQKALDILFNDNLIIRKQGSGTYVSPTYSSALDIISSQYGGTTQLFAGKATVSTQVLHFEIRLPTDEESQKLHIESTIPVYDIYRLRKLDNNPYELTKSIMPLSVISNLTKEVAERSIFAFIQHDLGLEIGNAVRRISADKTKNDDIQYLDCETHDPILQVSQTVSLKDGRIFEYAQTRHRYDKGSIVVFNKVPMV